MKRFLCIILAALFLCVPCFTQAQITGEAVWQDPNNIVLLWDAQPGSSYNILRSDSAEGVYVPVGSASGGAFRDAAAVYPQSYYYKIESADHAQSSAPIAATVAPEKLSSVSVIMYHHFVSEADEASGIVFEEYSLRPQDFEADLLWLRANGYTTITSADLLAYISGEQTLPHKAVILSIDDGSWGVYKHAWPLLEKYNMKADLNVIGAQIDATWDALQAGETRAGAPAPYCTWEELAKMVASGAIHLCSHSYGMHIYDTEGRIGMSLMAGETPAAYAAAVQRDYDLTVRCIEGWTGTQPRTVAYPYSKRSDESDRLILENTGYQLLMGGREARGTAGNYFVAGCTPEAQLRLMSRPCRMHGTPIGDYLTGIEEQDAQNGVNAKKNTLCVSDTDAIAADYVLFDDVATGDWFSGSVYYAYLNGLMRGVSQTQFAPQTAVSRAMAATLLCRLAGNPAPQAQGGFADATADAWWLQAALWADENGILTAADGQYMPDGVISRAQLAQAMYACARSMQMDVTARADLSGFSDAGEIAAAHREAVSWAVAVGVFRGNADGTFRPQGTVTRAELSMVLRNWLTGTNR